MYGEVPRDAEFSRCRHCAGFLSNLEIMTILTESSTANNFDKVDSFDKVDNSEEVDRSNRVDIVSTIGNPNKPGK